MGELENWTINWEKHLNGSLTIRNIREREAYKLLLRKEGFRPTKEIIEADKTKQVTLSVLKSLIDDNMVFFIKLNNKYWWKLTPLGYLEHDVGKSYA